MPNDSMTAPMAAVLPPGFGVSDNHDRSSVNVDISIGHELPSRRLSPHRATDIAARLLSEGGVIRRAARAALVAERQVALGQYFTPLWVARMMAAMCEVDGRDVRVLDPGAGAGTLFAALAARLLALGGSLRSFSITAFELDPALKPFLEQSARAIRGASEACDVACDIELRQEDFVEWGTRIALGNLLSEPRRFDAAILNPPYKKLHSGSDLRRHLDQLEIAAPNLYAAFLGLAISALRPGGIVVAIVPRSFCNGTYFKRFRRYLLDSATIERVHLFSDRDCAFGQDAVLQENMILAMRKRPAMASRVSLSFSAGSETDPLWSRRAALRELVRPEDPDLFIHIPPDAWNTRLAQAMENLPSALDDLGLSVSTGPIVSFRMQKWFARPGALKPVVPFLHPANFRDLAVRWPIASRKPQALAVVDDTERALVPSGWYVVTRRFSSKEEARRIVASVINPAFAGAKRYAIENHLNYFHRGGGPLDRDQALGLATYLNSLCVDKYFRQFSGHTQVNVTDLRKLRYPSAAHISHLGSSIDSPLSGISADEALRQYCPELKDMLEPNHMQDRIADALSVLRALGLPKEQQNERSALTLLAILHLSPTDPWAAAAAPLIGVTPIMEWVATHYGRRYAPNTRETFRRNTLHQFVDAGLVVPNPDQPDRPVNSPLYCYQIEPEAHALLKMFNTSHWDSALACYLQRRPTLMVKYAQRREMYKIPLVLKSDVEIRLTPGEHNELVSQIINEFSPRFIPGGEPVYVGDAGSKWAFFDHPLAAELGIAIDTHGKMPDVVIYDRRRNWLFLIEAVTSHGPVNAKRMRELKTLLASVDQGLVFVTAFPDRGGFLQHFGDVAWETEVWIAKSPSHLVHFDGNRLLGPYGTYDSGKPVSDGGHHPHD